MNTTLNYVFNNNHHKLVKVSRDLRSDNSLPDIKENRTYKEKQPQLMIYYNSSSREKNPNFD